MCMKQYVKKTIRLMLVLIPFFMMTQVENVYASSSTPTPTPKQVQGNVTVSSDNIYDDEEITVELEIQGTQLVNVEAANDIVLLLDCSGSMASDEKFSGMISASKKFIENTNFSKQRVSIVSYATEVNSCKLSTDKSSLETYLDGLEASGGTNTHLAIDEAVSILQSQKRDKAHSVMVLLTDGAATDQTAALQAAETAKTLGIRFYTVGLYGASSSGSSAYEDMLKQIATTADHHYFVGPDGVVEVYKEIAAEIAKANAYEVVIEQTLSSAFEIVPDSAEITEIVPTVTSDTIKWKRGELKDETLYLRYKVKVKEGTKAGTYPLTSYGKITYLDYLTNTKRFTLPVVNITVNKYPPTITSVSSTEFQVEGGEAFTIKGTHFEPDTDVYIGTARILNITVVDSNTITGVMVPRNQGVNVLKVINPDEKSASTDVRFVATPEISSVSPASGAYTGGTKVTIKGNYFMTGAVVTFDGVAAEVKNTYSEKLVVYTPALNKSGTVDIKVENPDGTSVVLSNGYTYEEEIIVKPEIEKISANNDFITGGTTVTITGDNFGTVQGKVYFGTQEATVTSWATGRIKVVVPAVTTPECVSIKVEDAEGKEGQLENAFTYKALPELTLTDISSYSTVEGTAATIKVFGSNFDYGDDFQVLIGGVEAEIKTETTSYVKVITPSSLVPGTYDIEVHNQNGLMAKLDMIFTVSPKPEEPAPEITSLSANSSIVGETNKIKIYANNLRYGDNFKVFIGGVEAEISSTTGKYVKISVPLISIPGTYDVTVQNEDGTTGTLSNGYTYNPVPPLPAPNITRLTVTSGTVGTATKVYADNIRYGDNFKVFVGGVQANIKSRAGKYVNIQIPNGLAPGTYSVTIENNDGMTGTMDGAFTVK